MTNQNYRKEFLTEKRAKEFAAYLIEQGKEDITISAWRDAFNQTAYAVEWNNKEED